MRIAGIRLSSGEMRWVDAGSHDLALMARVRASLAGEIVEGIVYVTPEQLLRPPSDVSGFLLEVQSGDSWPIERAALPGAELPPLGSRVTSGALDGTVTRLDPVNGRMTVAARDGGEHELPADLPG